MLSNVDCEADVRGNYGRGKRTLTGSLKIRHVVQQIQLWDTVSITICFPFIFNVLLKVQSEKKSFQ